MSKKRAFVRYSKQGKIVPGSLILTSGSFPSGPSTWNEVPADLCCNTIKDYTCCIAIQVIADEVSGLYRFTLQTRNGGPNVKGSVHWTSTESENFSIPADGDDYGFEYNFGDQIPHTVYLCIDNPNQIQDFEIGFGPGIAIAISNLQKLEGIEEWDGDGSGFGASNWKPVAPGSTSGGTGQDNAKLFIQKESKMNEGDFDEGFDNETPF
jgi:hypothetical protein